MGRESKSLQLREAQGNAVTRRYNYLRRLVASHNDLNNVNLICRVRIGNNKRLTVDIPR